MVVQLGIDVLSEFDPAAALDLAEASRLIPGRRRGERAALAVVQRWANPRRGCPTRGGRVVLPTVMIGGQRLTLAAWVEAFQRARVWLGTTTVTAPPAGRTERQGRAGHRRACDELGRAGFPVGG